MASRFDLYPTAVSWTLWRNGFNAARSWGLVGSEWVRINREGYQCEGCSRGVIVRWLGSAEVEQPLEEIGKTLVANSFTVLRERDYLVVNREAKA